MLELHQASPERLRRVEAVLTDIDDTLSTEGKIRPEAYQSLWDLKEAGLRVVVVTGRPAGWCDHIARFWPVDAVVGENGGLVFRHHAGKLARRYLHDEETRAGFRKRLEKIRERVLAEVPGCGIASDQPYREYDLAVDFCEDVPPLPREAVLRIQAIFQEEGAHAKISSIHVNGWFGDFDKLTTSLRCLEENLGMDASSGDDRFAFCGDSPNDEPMFAHFALSFGMANVRPFLDLMEHRPAFITAAPCGEGFREVAERIIEGRR